MPVESERLCFFFLVLVLVSFLWLPSRSGHLASSEVVVTLVVKEKALEQNSPQKFDNLAAGRLNHKQKLKFMNLIWFFGK